MDLEFLSGGNRRLVSVSHSDTVVCVGSTPTLRTKEVLTAILQYFFFGKKQKNLVLPL